MRRNTYSAQLFGQFLKEIRTVHTKKSMHQVELDFGLPLAALSTYERGVRAVKENRIKDLADALGVDARDLKMLWLWCQGLRLGRYNLPEYCDDVRTQRRQIFFYLGRILPGYESPTHILKIEPEKPITHSRKSQKKNQVRDAISMLTVSESDKVLGYIDCLLEQRLGKVDNGKPAA